MGTRRSCGGVSSNIAKKSAIASLEPEADCFSPSLIVSVFDQSNKEQTGTGMLTCMLIPCLIFLALTYTNGGGSLLVGIARLNYD